MPKARWQILLMWVLGLALAASLVMVFYQTRQIWDLRHQAESDQRALRDAGEALRRRSRFLGILNI